MSLTRVVVAEDETLFRQLLLSQLARDPEIQVVGEAESGERAVELAKQLEPEVMLMDIEMGAGMTGIQAGHAIKALNPSTGIVLLSNHKAKEFIVKSGGWSYLLKRNVRDLDTVVRAVKGAAWGMIVIDPQLTEGLKPRTDSALARLLPEQLKILELVAQGYNNRAIAAEMSMDERNVQRHFVDILGRLGIDADDKADPRILAVRAYLDQTRGL